MKVLAITPQGQYRPFGSQPVDLPGQSASSMTLTPLGGTAAAVAITANVPVTATVLVPGTGVTGSQVVSVRAGRTLVAPVTAPRGARRGSAFAVVIKPLAGSGPLYAARVETQGQDTIVSILPATSALTTISLPPVRDSYDAISPP